MFCSTESSGTAVCSALFRLTSQRRLTADGREATLYWVKPGQTCILALTATFKRERYPAWAQTEADPISFVVVPEPAFRELLAEPAFRDFTLEVLSSRVFELMVSLEELGSLRVQQRVAGFLLRHADPTGTVRVSQERLAGHLGTAREVVSRALRSLVAGASVATARSRIRAARGAAIPSRRRSRDRCSGVIPTYDATWRSAIAGSSAAYTARNRR
jgi:CRP/FNR family transcriptional regulator